MRRLVGLRVYRHPSCLYQCGSNGLHGNLLQLPISHLLNPLWILDRRSCCYRKHHRRRERATWQNYVLDHPMLFVPSVHLDCHVDLRVCRIDSLCVHSGPRHTSLVEELPQIACLFDWLTWFRPFTSGSSQGPTKVGGCVPHPTHKPLWSLYTLFLPHVYLVRLRSYRALERICNWLSFRHSSVRNHSRSHRLVGNFLAQ